MKRHLRAPAIITLALSLLAGTRAGADDLVPADTLAQIDYYKFWQAQVPLRPDEQLIDLYLIDENLYAVTSRSVVYALHADVGVVRWLFELGGAGHRIYPPSHVQSFYGRRLVLITSTKDIRWIDRATGEQVARLDLDFVPSAGAVSDGVRVYVPGMDAMLHCYELFPFGGGVSTARKWRISTNKNSVTEPVLWGGALFVASKDGRMRVCEAVHKGRLWVFNAHTEILANFLVDASGVFFGGLDQNIYKLDVATGRALWRYRTPGVILDPPVLVDDLLVQPVRGHGVYALDAASGEFAWHAPAGREFVCATGELITFLSDYGDIISFERSGGALKAQVFAPQVSLVARNPFSHAMYLGSSDGRLFCGQDKTIPYLRFEQIQAKIQPDEVVAAESADSAQGAERRELPALRELLQSRSGQTDEDE